MSYQEIPMLDSKGLRQFGLMLGIFVALVFGMLLPWIWEWEDLPNFAWIGVGGLLLLWAVLAPGSMKGLYIVWMRVALIIGLIVNFIILSSVFFFLITPMGLVFRVLGKDPMRRSFDDSAMSYRVASKVAAPNHVERPY